ncbi:eCIS core domain-containing protein [Massilia endophytica]|uniref:eCIS core domain-containing protein n=1 Tax=Massilia endophytica TaxID=2899220 RepID=UPI001E37FAC8|nr:DUF4157 domain-containing protein [Massilia endophytica]UGQ44853.1 DUF4157 domain-containing protein [Massilia endophytica]
MKAYAGNKRQSEAKEPVQRRFKPLAGLADNRPQAAVQRKLQEAANSSPRVAQLHALEGVANSGVAQRAKNHTGLPDNLKSGIERLSGHSMDDVKVHYNSSKPAQLNAHAYAQGRDIHLASGQEKHLAHEAWHVVQQKQGRVKPTMQMKRGTPVNDDKRLEREADVMGAKALQMKPGPATLPSRAASAPAAGASPVQRAVKEATVSWAITHLVQARGESLFGEHDDWQSREVPGKLGQLSHGQKIVVDDEAVFMSRRGGNQEKASRREADREADELRHKWLKVLFVWDGRAFVKPPEDSYVRAETVKLPAVEKPPQKKIGIERHKAEDETVSHDLQGFHDAWSEAAKKRRRSIGRVVGAEKFDGESTEHGDDITSGWNWDKYDEGENVSGDMKKPSERIPFGKAEDQHVLSASYQGAHREPVAYMVLEKDHYMGVNYMYIRWLIGHPDKGGGGSALVKDAIARFKAQKECTELRVDSAFSAVGWYESLGFRKMNPEKDAVKKGVGYADTQLVYP